MDYKNQHWIPRSYLKAWCDPSHKDRVVHVYSADGGHQGWRPYSRIFSADDLYTVESDGKRDTQAEKTLKVIEDLFLKARRAIEGNEGWRHDTKTILAWFVAAMRNRSPAARDHWQRFKDRIVEVGDDIAAGLASMSLSEREKMARASILHRSGRAASMTLEEARAVAAEPFGRWVLRHIATEANFLSKMSFVVIKAPQGVGFITSDNPVVWHDAAPLGRQTRHIGLGHRGVEVTMPLSPGYCVMFDHLGRDGLCEASQITVDTLNSRTLSQCQSCFVAQTGELVVDWLPTRESAQGSGA